MMTLLEHKLEPLQSREKTLSSPKNVVVLEATPSSTVPLESENLGFAPKQP